jgi:hypothetical protein
MNPTEVRSFFVTYPYALIAANMPVVMKKTCAIDAIV